jgi:hypothetical protein
LKDITIYQENGQIIGCFSIPENDIELMTDGNLYIECKSDPLNQYVSDNQVVNFPPKPNDGYIFNYETKSWVGDYESSSVIVKNKRNLYLSNSDWTQIPNNPLPLELQSAWSVYRQELRDIPEQSGYPYNVVWPTPPQG